MGVRTLGRCEVRTGVSAEEVYPTGLPGLFRVTSEVIRGGGTLESGQGSRESGGEYSQ